MKVLIATNSEQTEQMLMQALPQGGYQVDTLAASAPLAHRLAQGDIGMLLLAVPQASYPLLSELAALCQRHPMPVALFVKQTGSVVTDDVLASGVSMYVIDGLDVGRIVSVLEVARSRFKQLDKLKADLDTARRSLQERKIIERAKGILMRQNGCSEEDAYRSLRNTAMNKNKRLAEVANDVVSVVEMLRSAE